MERNESIELLTDKDIALINNLVEKPNLSLLIFTMMFTILSYFGSVFLKTFLPLIIFAILSSIVAVWYFWMRRKISRYIQSGTKIIIKGKIEDKFEKSIDARRTKKYASANDTFGFFIVDGFQYMVPYHDYTQHNKGDQIVMQLTKDDEIVFKVD